MAWKMKLGRRGSKASSGLLGSSPGSQGSNIPSTIKRPPTKGCLRKDGSKSESSLESSGVSAGSSTRSETEKLCDQSSSFQTQAVESADSLVSQYDSLDQPYNNCTIQAVQSQTSGSTVSSKSKRVKFSVVEIRDYEREVGDNPSCTDGCPIGIGWTHVDSRVVHVNKFENSRPYRKAQLEMVLTRDEREAILAMWGAHSHEIVSGTRALLKAKCQRRQTIQNLSKASVEEGIENATRKLKEMLLLKQSTKKQVRALQRQAETVAALSCNSQKEASKRHSSSMSSVPYPEIIDANRNSRNAFQCSLRPVRGTESVDDSDLFHAPSASVLEDDAIDAVSCISGFTLGNSTTASVREIERFYQELEIELFGDQELPSMVGKTLEVDVEIPDEQKIYHDPSPDCGAQEPPSVVSDLLLDESVVRQTAQILEQVNRCHNETSQSLHNVQFFPSDAFGNTSTSRGYSGYPRHDDRGDHITHRCNLRMDASLGAIDVPPEHSPVFAHAQGRLAERIPYSTINSTINWGTVNAASKNEGPAVSHVPLLSYLSSTRWMEGSPSQQIGRAHANQWEAVIISEEEDENILDGLFVEQQTEQYKVNAKMQIQLI